MTDDRMALLALLEKRADADLVREMLAFAAERLMTVEVEDLTGAPVGVRSPERLNPRAAQSAEWLSRARLGHAGRPDRSGHPQAAQALLLRARAPTSRRSWSRAARPRRRSRW